MPKKKRIVYRKKSIMDFGKYRGWFVRDVLDIEPSYLLWANKNVSWFKLDRGLLEEAQSEDVEKKFTRRVRRHVAGFSGPENSPYWFEDDNGSWLT